LLSLRTFFSCIEFVEVSQTIAMLAIKYLTEKIDKECVLNYPKIRSNSFVLLRLICLCFIFFIQKVLIFFKIFLCLISSYKDKNLISICQKYLAFLIC